MSFRRLPTPHVKISQAALNDGIRHATSRLPSETGGILLGWRDTGSIHVEGVIEIPDPLAENNGYERDHAAAQSALSAAMKHQPSGSLLGYVGEWHTHPALQPPSRQDQKELRAIGRVVVGSVVMVVLATSGDGRWRMHAMVASGRTVRTTTIGIGTDS